MINTTLSMKPLAGRLAGRHRVHTVGAGKELVVFSHGFGLDQTTWHKVVERLDSRFTAVLYDLPGAGPLLPADFNPDDYASLAAFADDLLNLLEELDIERCYYVGHSVSGMVGALAAIEAPHRFRKLILINPSPRYLNDVGYVGGFDQEGLDNLYKAISANYQGWVAGFAPLVVGTELPHAISEFSAGLLAMRPDVTARIAKTIFQSDVRNLLPLLEVQTTLIHARGDIAVPEQVAHYLNEHIAGSRLRWISEPGHLPQITVPDQIADILNDELA